MDTFSDKIVNFRASIWEQNHLAQICGSKHLFRDRYAIIRIIGRGGFGITFLAQDAILPGNPLCVIKQLCPKVSNAQIWQSACDRFHKEAKTLAKLGSHSQIPMLLDYFEGNGELYLVQEYIPGGTLGQEVKRNGTKTEAVVTQFLRELLPVLQYLYHNQVIHRDIKPQNLLRCVDDQRIVLIDFGAVKENLASVGATALHDKMNTNFVGTMGFAPPEQLSMRPVYASDIYALGMTCIYLLTGKGPLEMEHDSQTGEISWRKYANVSESFARILSKMVKMSLKERFQKPGDVIRALKAESDFPDLAQCLTTQPLRKIHSPAQVEVAQEYISPLTRTAIAIRERNARKAKLNPKY